MSDNQGPSDDKVSVAMPVGAVSDPTSGLDDGREPWEWQTRFPPEAKKLINREACVAGGYLAVFLVATFVCAGFVGKTFELNVAPNVAFLIDTKLLAIFFTGALGGTTFSIKWLMHSVAKGKWHVDRFLWRVFVPLVGGVYAVIVSNLIGGGLIGGGQPKQDGSIATITALAFLVGYFSDGVSGLLTNVANAVFGTVEKK
jgi:hypothetical protein